MNDATAQIDGLLRFHFKIDTDLISDEKFCELEAKLTWVLRQKGELE